MPQNYNTIVATLNAFAQHHLGVKRYKVSFFEQMDNFSTSGNTFPILYSIPNNVDLDENIDVFNFRVYCLDILQKDRSNEQFIMNDTLLVLRDLVNWIKLDENNNINLLNIPSAQPINNYLMDFVAGWYIDVSIEAEGLTSDCFIPFDMAWNLTGVTCSPTVIQKFLTCETLQYCQTIINIENTLASLSALTDTRVTGFTYNNLNTFTISDSTGGTFSAAITNLSASNLSANTYYSAGTPLSDIINNAVLSGTSLPSTQLAYGSTGNTLTSSSGLTYSGGILSLTRSSQANVTNFNISAGSGNTSAFQINTDTPNLSVNLNSRNNYLLGLQTNDITRVLVTTTGTNFSNQIRVGSIGNNGRVSLVRSTDNATQTLMSVSNSNTFELDQTGGPRSKMIMSPSGLTLQTQTTTTLTAVDRINITHADLATITLNGIITTNGNQIKNGAPATAATDFVIYSQLTGSTATGATLAATQIGFGASSNTLTGTSSLIFQQIPQNLTLSNNPVGNRFVATESNTTPPVISSDMATNYFFSYGSTSGFGFLQTVNSSGGLAGYALQVLGGVKGLRAYNQAAGVYVNTSIATYSTLNLFNEPYNPSVPEHNTVIEGNKWVINLLGSYTRNGFEYGTRLDYQGLKIGSGKTLHTGNTVALQVDGRTVLNGDTVVGTGATAYLPFIINASGNTSQWLGVGDWAAPLSPFSIYGFGIKTFDNQLALPNKVYFGDSNLYWQTGGPFGANNGGLVVFNDITLRSTNVAGSVDYLIGSRQSNRPTITMNQGLTTGNTIETQGFLWNGNIKGFSGGGTLPLQRENVWRATTYTASTSTTATTVYGNYFERPIASTNFAIINNYAAAFNGSVIITGNTFTSSQGYFGSLNNDGAIYLNRSLDGMSNVSMRTLSGSTFELLQGGGLGSKLIMSPTGFTVQTESSTTNTLNQVLNISHGVVPATTLSTTEVINQPLHLSATTATEFSSFKKNGNLRGWIGGNIALQRENWWTASTYSATTPTIFNTVYSHYIEVPLTGTNVSFTQAYALGLDGGMRIYPKRLNDGIRIDGTKFTSVGATLMRLTNSNSNDTLTILDSDLKVRLYAGGGLTSPTLTSNLDSTIGIGFGQTSAITAVSIITNNVARLVVSGNGTTSLEGNQIKNLAPGTLGTDAVNYSQLTAATPVRFLAKDAQNSQFFSGTTGNTIVKSAFVPANTVSANDILYFNSTSVKSGTTASLTIRLYVSSGNTLTLNGATLLATNSIGAANAYANTVRTFFVQSITGGTKGYPAATTTGTDAGIVSNVAVNNALIDWTQDRYVMLAHQMSTTGDASLASSWIVEKN